MFSERADTAFYIKGLPDLGAASDTSSVTPDTSDTARVVQLVTASVTAQAGVHGVQRGEASGA
jgi:hypothetical protein